MRRRVCVDVAERWADVAACGGVGCVLFFACSLSEEGKIERRGGLLELTLSYGKTLKNFAGERCFAMRS